ncbi:hypothetical protein BB560_005217, partial [Smittium megazygosporum]
LEGFIYVITIHIFQIFKISLEFRFGIPTLSFENDKKDITKTGNSTERSFEKNEASNNSPKTEQEKLMNFYQSRQNPDIIKRKIHGAMFSTFLNLIVTLIYLKYFASTEPKNDSVLGLMGFGFGTEPFSSLQIFTILIFAYSGPLYYEYLNGSVPVVSQIKEFEESIKRWNGFRDYLVGPITEELTFRSCVVPLFNVSAIAKNNIKFLAPLIFGIAHLHHIYEKRKSGLGWKYAVFSSDSIYACILAHIFCNVMGLPTIQKDYVYFKNYKD